jgi:hypothetical protein
MNINKQKIGLPSGLTSEQESRIMEICEEYERKIVELEKRMVELETVSTTAEIEAQPTNSFVIEEKVKSIEERIAEKLGKDADASSVNSIADKIRSEMDKTADVARKRLATLKLERKQ